MRKTVSLILAVVICFSLFSCAASYGRFTVAEAAPKMNVTYADYRQDGYEAFVDKLAAFSARLTDAVVDRYGDNDDNIVISPVSVYMALALAVECTEGETRDEILSAVGVSYEEVEGFTAYLYAFLNRDFTYENPFGQEKVLAKEEISNSFWAAKGLSLKDSGVMKLADDYNCDLYRVDFASGEARRAIGDYIKDKTHGLCDGDVEFTPETIIALINTFYLKEVWNREGDELSLTDDVYDFRCSDGEMEKTRLLMGYYQGGRVYDGEGYSVFYTKTNHGFSIKFILPDEGKSVSEVFTAENIYAVASLDDFGGVDDENERMYFTRTFFPEYEADFDDDIRAALGSLGISALFDRSAADFGGITDMPAYCSGVIHQCELEVSRKGIEGAAVTILAVDGTAGDRRDEYERIYSDFIVDRAFGFVITDSYGAVVFSGIVNEI